MELQYRIEKSDKVGEAFAHVRIKKFFFWGRWKRICTDPNGFKLVPVSDRAHLNNSDECVKIIKSFDIWFKKKQNKGYYYEQVNI